MVSAVPIVDAELLRSFAAFGTVRNFTHAARALGLSQPALFERVQRLSEQLGLVLYERRGRDLALTAEGMRVLAFARELDGRFRDFALELSGVAAPRSVTLAAGEGSYLYLLGPALAGFSAACGASLDLLTTGARATVAAVLQGEAQLGVAVLDLVPRGIDAEELVQTPLCAALPARHPLARKRTLTLRDLRAERLVLTPDGQLHRDLVSRAFARSGDAPTRFLEADGWPLMLKLVALELGVAVVNGICELPRGVVMRPLPELGRVTYRLLQRRGAKLGAEALLLARRIRETVSGSRTKRSGSRS